MKSRIAALAICVFCLSLTVFAQKITEKPFEKWSKDEAMKIISNPPWADQYQSTSGLVVASRQQQSREQADTRLSGSNRGSSSRFLTPPPIVIRLHSALPVRQAMVRLQQIQAGYDKMNEEQRNKFDESTKNFLNCSICQNYYVVTLTKFRDASLGTVDDGIFQTLKYEDLKDKIWLITDKNEKRELAQFTPPKGSGDSAVFFFKRKDETGAPLLTTENKQLKFVFANELLDNNNAYSALIPRAFEFKVSKLIVDNKVEF